MLNKESADVPEDAVADTLVAAFSRVLQCAPKDVLSVDETVSM